jgi:hypothetical protein
MTSKNNAKFAFYYLLSLASLIFVAISVGLIIFGIINKSIVDPLSFNNYRNFQDQFKFAISALLIAAPAYYLTLSLIKKGLRKKEIETDSGIRRWLTYFILFVSSLIILGSFISLINSFLSGELTLRFILKAVAVLIISGLSFSYYLYDIKRDNPSKKTKFDVFFLIISLLIVVGSFVAVWFFVDSPKEARGERYDQAIERDMNNVEGLINNYYAKKGRLPESFSEIKEISNTTHIQMLDEIDYKKTKEESYELCADFKTENLDDPRFSNSKSYHDKGYYCFDGNLWEKNLSVPRE